MLQTNASDRSDHRIYIRLAVLSAPVQPLRSPWCQAVWRASWSQQIPISTALLLFSWKRLLADGPIAPLPIGGPLIPPLDFLPTRGWPLRTAQWHRYTGRHGQRLNSKRELHRPPQPQLLDVWTCKLRPLMLCQFWFTAGI